MPLNPRHDFGSFRAVAGTGIKASQIQIQAGVRTIGRFLFF